ncbi:MAG: VRR-NUC domain-containing protein [Akkermansia sp.]|nr:VRR-NUC domain-containing protein [Akkermansia sp.]
MPDRLVLLPGGRIYFVEMKRPKDGRLSPRQEWWGEKLTALGFEYRTIWDDADLLYFVEGCTG